MKRNNKKGISEIVSYVLIVVIALGISIGVYSWMRSYLPKDNNNSCPDDVAIFIKDYNCNNKILNLTLENKGNFDISGFDLRISNESDKAPIISIQSTKQLPDTVEGTIPGIPGRYYFYEMIPFSPNSIKVASFNYTNQEKILKIQIQPFIKDNSSLYLCTNIVNLDLENC